MDLDHLLKLVQACHDAPNNDESAYNELVAYFDETLGAKQRKRITFLESEVRRYEHEHQLDLERLDEARDARLLAELKSSGSKLIVDAVRDAALTDVTTRLCEIKIDRENGPSFYLVEALR